MSRVADYLLHWRLIYSQPTTAVGVFVVGFFACAGAASGKAGFRNRLRQTGQVDCHTHPACSNLVSGHVLHQENRVCSVSRHSLLSDGGGSLSLYHKRLCGSGWLL